MLTPITFTHEQSHRMLRAALHAVLAVAIVAILGLTAGTAHAAVFDGGGLQDGIGQASNVAGVAQGTLPDFVETVRQRALTYITLLALVGMVVAGFFLILGFGDEAAKERAKRIIIYTGVALILLYFADLIIAFFQTAGEQSLAPAIRELLDRALFYATLLAVVVVVTAGFYLILGFGDEAAKDKAKRMIIYTGAGLIVLYFAELMVEFFASAGEVDVHGPIEIIMNRLVLYLTLLGTVVIVAAGFVLVLSLGDESQKDRAKRMILYTIAGLVVVFFARVIVVFFVTLPAAG